MKLEIDIPSIIYNDAKENRNYISVGKAEIVWKAIADGKPLEQEPKTGHWEWIQYDGNPNIGNWHCSECRTIIPHMPEEIDNTPIYKWCPMCKVKIQEVEE